MVRRWWSDWYSDGTVMMQRWCSDGTVMVQDQSHPKFAQMKHRDGAVMVQ